jgi:hypothetical protein
MNRYRIRYDADADAYYAQRRLAPFVWRTISGYCSLHDAKKAVFRHNRLRSMHRTTTTVTEYTL